MICPHTLGQFTILPPGRRLGDFDYAVDPWKKPGSISDDLSYDGVGIHDVGSNALVATTLVMTAPAMAASATNNA